MKFVDEKKIIQKVYKKNKERRREGRTCENQIKIDIM